MCWLNVTGGGSAAATPPATTPTRTRTRTRTRRSRESMVYASALDPRPRQARPRADASKRWYGRRRVGAKSRRPEVVTMSTPIGKQAVVVGAGMGGLTAAAALADHFEHVIVLERDALPREVAHRAGTPQARHV